MFNPTTIALAISAATLLGSSLLPLRAQQSTADALQQWGLDPGLLVANGRELLQRAPDAAIDDLFQAAHASANSPQEAAALCQLFDPAADRSLTGLNKAANQLSPAHRDRFATAVANLLVAAMQSPAQPYDEAAARQSLKAAGVRTALVKDGFLAGLNGDNQDARCRSLGWLMDDLHAQPLPQRAAVARLLLGEGLGQLAVPAGAVTQEALPF